MKQFNIDTFNKSEFAETMKKSSDELIAKTKETIFEYVKSKVGPKHNHEYEVVMTKDGDKTVISPEEGMGKRAKTMEFGTTTQKPIKAWTPIFLKLRKVCSQSKNRAINLRSEFKRVIKPKDLDI